MLAKDRFVVYGGTGYHTLDAKVLELVNRVTNLRLDFSHIWHTTWTDDEPGFSLAKPEHVRGRHAIVFACPVTNKLENELKDIVTACKHQYGAASVTAVLSFLRFRRQDREELQHEITRLRWFIRNLAHWGVDRLVVCEPHSVRNTQKYCDEFRVALSIVDPTRLFAEAIMPVVRTLGGPERVRVHSPDLGSVGRALALAQAIGTIVVATPKRRVNSRIELVESADFLERVAEAFGAGLPISCEVEQLRGFHVFMREDELDSGTTAVETARRLKTAGTASMHFIATNPVCSRKWKIRLFPHDEEPPFQTIWLGNTRPRGNRETEYEGSTGRVTKVDMAPVIAETLTRVLETIAD